MVCGAGYVRGNAQSQGRNLQRKRKPFTTPPTRSLQFDEMSGVKKSHRQHVFGEIFTAPFWRVL